MNESPNTPPAIKVGDKVRFAGRESCEVTKVEWHSGVKRWCVSATGHRGKYYDYADNFVKEGK